MDTLLQRRLTACNLNYFVVVFVKLNNLLIFIALAQFFLCVCSFLQDHYRIKNNSVAQRTFQTYMQRTQTTPKQSVVLRVIRIQNTQRSRKRQGDRFNHYTIHACMQQY